MSGNVWDNVFGLIDVSASPGLVSDTSKFEKKIKWLMTLVVHAAPTAMAALSVGDDSCMPDADLAAAATARFGAIEGLAVTGWVEEVLGIG